MLKVPETEASVQKLLDLLTCDNCGHTLHEPFTTGVCVHTLCHDCCHGVNVRYSVRSTKQRTRTMGNTCPKCQVPVRPCDIKPHPQLSSLVLVARRLAKLLKLPSDGNSEEATQSSCVEKLALNDAIDLLDTGTYCRVDSPSPSPIANTVSKPDLSVIENPEVPAWDTIGTAMALSPISCSVKLPSQLPDEMTSEVIANPDETSEKSTSSSVMPPPKNFKPLRNRSAHKPPPTSPSPGKQASPKVEPPKEAPLASPEPSFLTSEFSELQVAPEKPVATKSRKSALKQGWSKKSKKMPSLRNVRKSRFATGGGESDLLRVNSKGETSLHRAAIKNDVEQLRKLLGGGLSPNLRDHAGWTPLHEAALRGHTESVECLLKDGRATVDLPGGPDLETPLHEAVVNGRLDCVRLLLDHKASAHFANGLGLSPLQVCASLVDDDTKTSKPSKKAKKSQRPLVVLNEIHDLLLHSNVTHSPDTISENAPVAGEGDDNNNTTELNASALFIERRRLRPVLLGTGLSRPQRTQFARVAALIHARVTSEMSSEVTHLVTSKVTPNRHSHSGAGAKKRNGCISEAASTAVTSPEGGGEGVTCPRTLKFLFAVLQGCWVLSFDWVETCEMMKMRVEEEAFEVTGCSSAPTTGASMRARRAREAGSAGLFHGFRFCLLGTFEYPTPSRADLSALTSKGGGTVFSRDITSASRLAYLAVDDPAVAANWMVQQQAPPSGGPPTIEPFVPSQVPIESDQLIALCDPRACGLGGGNTASQAGSQALSPNNRPDLLVSEALAMLQPKSLQNSSPPAPIRLLPAMWVMDCVAAYAIVSPPAKFSR